MSESGPVTIAFYFPLIPFPFLPWDLLHTSVPSQHSNLSSIFYLSKSWVQTVALWRANENGDEMSNYQKYSYKALLFWISAHNARPISSATAETLNKLKLQSIPLPWLAFISNTYCGVHATYLPTCLYLLCWGHRHSVVFPNISLPPRAVFSPCKISKLLI